MNQNKRGRKAFPEHMRGKTTSLRLRPDRLNLFKKMGGVKWLNEVLDHELAFNVAVENGMSIVDAIEYVSDLNSSYRIILKIRDNQYREQYALDQKG